MSLWNDQQFRERVLECGRAKGLESLEEIGAFAELDRHYFRDDKPTPKGRNITKILQLAAKLDVDPGYLIGISDSPEGDVSRHVARRMPELERLAFVANVAAHLYVAIGSRPLPPTPETKKFLDRLLAALDDL